MRKQKLISVSPSSDSDNSSITKLNRINTLGKKDLPSRDFPAQS